MGPSIYNGPCPVVCATLQRVHLVLLCWVLTSSAATTARYSTDILSEIYPDIISSYSNLTLVAKLAVTNCTQVPLVPWKLVLTKALANSSNAVYTGQYGANCTTAQYLVHSKGSLREGRYSVSLQAENGTSLLSPTSQTVHVVPPALAVVARQTVDCLQTVPSCFVKVSLASPSYLRSMVKLVVNDSSASVSPLYLTWEPNQTNTKNFEIRLVSAPLSYTISSQLVGVSNVLLDKATSRVTLSFPPTSPASFGFGARQVVSYRSLNETVNNSDDNCSISVPVSSFGNSYIPPLVTAVATVEYSSGNYSDLLKSLAFKQNISAGSRSKFCLPLDWSIVPYEAEVHVLIKLEPAINARVIPSQTNATIFIFGVPLGRCPPGTLKPLNRSNDDALYEGTAGLKDILLQVMVGGVKTHLDLDPPFQLIDTSYRVIVPHNATSPQLVFTGNLESALVQVNATDCKSNSVSTFNASLAPGNRSWEVPWDVMSLNHTCVVWISIIDTSSISNASLLTSFNSTASNTTANISALSPALYSRSTPAIVPLNTTTGVHANSSSTIFVNSSSKVMTNSTTIPATSANLTANSRANDSDPVPAPPNSTAASAPPPSVIKLTLTPLLDPQLLLLPSISYQSYNQSTMLPLCGLPTNLWQAAAALFQRSNTSQVQLPHPSVSAYCLNNVTVGSYRAASQCSDPVSLILAAAISGSSSAQAAIARGDLHLWSRPNTYLMPANTSGNAFWLNASAALPAPFHMRVYINRHFSLFCSPNKYILAPIAAMSPNLTLVAQSTSSEVEVELHGSYVMSFNTTAPSSNSSSPAAAADTVQFPVIVKALRNEGFSSNTYTIVLYRNASSLQPFMRPLAASQPYAVQHATPSLTASYFASRPAKWPPSPAQDCLLCGQGTYSSRVDAAACQPCPPGKSAPHPFSSACITCGLGTFTSSWGSTSCRPCLPGTYSNASGALYCEICPPSATNLQEGSAACDFNVTSLEQSARYTVMISFTVTLNGTDLSQLDANQTGIMGAAASVLRLLIQVDIATALNISNTAVQVSDVTHVAARLLQVDVSAIVALEGSDKDPVTELSADALVQRIVDNASFKNTATGTGASVQVTNVQVIKTSGGHGAVSVHAIIWPVLGGSVLLVAALLLCYTRFYRRSATSAPPATMSERYLRWLSRSPSSVTSAGSAASGGAELDTPGDGASPSSLVHSRLRKSGVMNSDHVEEVTFFEMYRTPVIARLS